MKDFIDFVERSIDGVPIREAWMLPARNNRPLSDFHSEDTVRQNLALPNMSPNYIDVTLEGWLWRLKTNWGEVSIEHDNPVLSRKGKITQEQFLTLMGNEANKRAYGEWEIEHLDFSRLTFWRNVHDFSGSRKKERIVVSIKLRPELKKATSWWRILNPFAK